MSEANDNDPEYLSQPSKVVYKKETSNLQTKFDQYVR